MSRRRRAIGIIALVISIVAVLILLARGAYDSYLRATNKPGTYCTPHPEPVCTPDPHGPRIAFSSDRACNHWWSSDLYASPYDIYVMNDDGTCATRLTRNRWSDSRRPRWSPEGTRILFETRKRSHSLYVMNADGSRMKRIADYGDCRPNARWSPDGSRIVFAAERDDGLCTLYITDADGGRKTILTDAPWNYWGWNREAEPVFGWSPDGTRIAFSGNDRKRDDVYAISVDEGAVTNLTNHPADDEFIAWSPDGRQMLFVSERAITSTEPQVWTLYVMDADGTNPRRLVDHVRYWPGRGTWVPSSDSQIVVEFEDALENEYHVIDIECVLANSTEPGVLPEECHYELPQPSGIMVFATWPPGGRQFSYQVIVNPNCGAKDIFVVNFDGTGLRNLTNCLADDIDPAWSP
jgi:Tol biopolymer transport system component